MIQSLKARIIESRHPVGMKRVNSWCLPPKSFSYGLPGKPDKEGVSKGTIIYNHNSYTKLEDS